MRTLTMAAGCFWCLDAILRRTRGVLEVESGYTGGQMDHPDYHSVCSGVTGHAEGVRVVYDDEVISEDILLDLFVTSHDPTSLNRQGHDVGTQYRSALFYADEAERERLAAALAARQELFSRPIVTTLEPVAPFWPAEDVHQDFYERNRFNGYCQVIIDPKLAAVRSRFADWVS